MGRPVPPPRARETSPDGGSSRRAAAFEQRLAPGRVLPQSLARRPPAPPDPPVAGPAPPAVGGGPAPRRRGSPRWGDDVARSSRPLPVPRPSRSRATRPRWRTQGSRADSTRRCRGRPAPRGRRRPPGSSGPPPWSSGAEVVTAQRHLHLPGGGRVTGQVPPDRVPAPVARPRAAAAAPGLGSCSSSRSGRSVTAAANAVRCSPGICSSMRRTVARTSRKYRSPISSSSARTSSARIGSSMPAGYPARRPAKPLTGRRTRPP